MQVSDYLTDAAYLRERGRRKQARWVLDRAERFAWETGYTELVLLVWAFFPRTDEAPR
jgi:hypothetical protein